MESLRLQQNNNEYIIGKHVKINFVGAIAPTTAVPGLKAWGRTYIIVQVRGGEGI